uniref:portal protein n=1 Tax=Phenylobacterium sp. TaxID=1871053 RepID=UPI0025CDCA19
LITSDPSCKSCGPKVQLMVRPPDIARVAALMRRDWVELAEREGTLPVPQAAGPDGYALGRPVRPQHPHHSGGRIDLGDQVQQDPPRMADRATEVVDVVEGRDVGPGGQGAAGLGAAGLGAAGQAAAGHGAEQLKAVGRIYDLGAGRYDLVVRSGPSFTSRREEAATQMIELIRAYPAAAPVLGDVLARNLDWPGADEIAGRLAALLPAQVKGASPETAAAKAQLGQLAQALAAARTEIAGLRQDRSHEARKLEIEAFEAETNRLRATQR